MHAHAGPPHVFMLLLARPGERDRGVSISGRENITCQQFRTAGRSMSVDTSTSDHVSRKVYAGQLAALQTVILKKGLKAVKQAVV